VPHEDLSHIWHLSHLDGDGRLDLGEFVVAMHLVARRRENYPLPERLPPELRAAAEAANARQGARPTPTGAALVPGGSSVAASAPRDAFPGGGEWEIDAETMLQYREIFEGVDRASPEALSGDEARAFLDRSQLLVSDLSHIWHMSDADGDGQLVFPEFVCALHLVSRRLAGAALPPALPPELLASSRRWPPTVSAATAADHGGGGCGEDVGSGWQLTPDRLEAYREVFEGVPRQDPNFLSAEEAREVLERSGLPHPELAHIWGVADADADGRLSLPEFACAMHLVAGAAAEASSSPPLCRPSSPPRWRHARRSRSLHRRPRRRGSARLTMVGQLCQVRTMCRVIILSSLAWTYSAPDGWAPTRCRTCSIDPRSPPPTPPASFRCRTPMRMGC